MVNLLQRDEGDMQLLHLHLWGEMGMGSIKMQM